MNGLFNKLDIPFFPLLNERNLDALDLVWSKFSNFPIKELLGVTSSIFQGLIFPFRELVEGMAEAEAMIVTGV